MKTLYLECNMGAAGDMLFAALLELHPEPEAFLERFRKLEIPGIQIEREKAVKCGIQGTHMKISVYGEEEENCPSHGEEHSHQKEHHHEEHSHDGHHHEEHSHKENHHHEEHHHHHHTTMEDIRRLVGSFSLSEKVKQDILAVYESIAEGESHAHDMPVEQIHFHEVGTMDAVADVTGVCMLMEELAPERVVASPVHVGSGQVRCAHGILPVPAPATAYILQGVPIYGGSIKGELCTPTGAALLKYFAEDFGEMPVMVLQKTGYGMGKKDFSEANCVRALWGEEKEAPMDTIAELCCNLDDMTPEAVGFVVNLLLEEGALEVYTTPVQMKKNRPGVVLTCMCPIKEKEKYLNLLFLHTTTLGIREYICKRYGMKRWQKKETTLFGEVRKKYASGYGVEKEKWEYEDIAGIAKEKNLSLAQVVRKLEEG